MEPGYQAEYQFKMTPGNVPKKGVFIVINLHRYNYVNPPKSTLRKAQEKDEINLARSLNLEFEDGDSQSKNLLKRVNLTQKSGEGGFDYFMDHFKSQLEEQDPANADPSFVLFVILGHGSTHGRIMMATDETAAPVRNCKCNGLNHKGDKTCNYRYLDKDVMTKVDEAYKDQDIPKIYLVSTCRGDEQRNATPSGKSDATVEHPNDWLPSEIEFFTPDHPDTFLFRACVEDNTSDVYADGSNFIKQFCKAMEQLYAVANSYSELEGGAYSQRMEDVSGGWLPNVCQYTSLLASERDRFRDKEQPHFCSSLRYNFSCLKMLKTQWGVEHRYLRDWYGQEN